VPLCIRPARDRKLQPAFTPPQGVPRWANRGLRYRLCGVFLRTSGLSPESVLTEVDSSGNIHQLELKGRNQLRSIFVQLSHSLYELFNERDRELRLNWVMEPGAKVSQFSGDLLAYRSAWNFSWRTQSIDDRPVHTLHFVRGAAIAPPDSQVALPEQNGAVSLCPTPSRYQRPGRERTSAVVFQSRPRNEHTTHLRQWSDLSDRCQYRWRWVERIQ